MKKCILFVGSFKDKARDGSVGGQMFACNSLLKSDKSAQYDFILVDSTADSVPAPPLVRRLLKALVRLAKIMFYLVTRRIDVFFVFSSAGFSFKEKGLVVMLARAAGKRVFFFPRSGLVKDDVKKNRFNYRFVSQVIKESHYVICQGASWKSFYQAMEPNCEEKFVVMQNWIDVRPYGRSQRPQNAIPVIVYLGWLEPYKGILDLLEVSHRLAEAGVQFRVHVYGSGSLETSVKRYVRENGMEPYFHLKGWASESVKLTALQNADVFVLPSYREGFPNALLEAMASGIASIGSNVGGVPGLIEHGINGFMIEPGDKEALKGYLSTLLSDSGLRKSLGRSAMEKVIGNNSVEQAWSTLSSLIDSNQ